MTLAEIKTEADKFKALGPFIQKQQEEERQRHQAESRKQKKDRLNQRIAQADQLLEQLQVKEALLAVRNELWGEGHLRFSHFESEGINGKGGGDRDPYLIRMISLISENIDYPEVRGLGRNLTVFEIQACDLIRINLRLPEHSLPSISLSAHTLSPNLSIQNHPLADMVKTYGMKDGLHRIGSLKGYGFNSFSVLQDCYISFDPKSLPALAEARGELFSVLNDWLENNYTADKTPKIIREYGLSLIDQIPGLAEKGGLARIDLLDWESRVKSEPLFWTAFKSRWV